jgi:phosphomannomutase
VERPVSGLRVVAFDLDDTLAPSKSPIEPRMADLLDRLMRVVDVCIISGGSFEQFESQVLKHLGADPAALARLHLMPTCGTRYYRWVDGRWHEEYAEDLPDDLKAQVIGVLTDGAKELGLWESKTWGDIIEDRGSQVTFSALGQAAPVDAKRAWDPDGSKKERLRAYAAARLPDLEVRSGGSTSVDVTRKGIGNDFPVKSTGVPSVAVSGWPETADYVEELLRHLPAG